MRSHLLTTVLILLFTPLALTQSQSAPTPDSLTADYTAAMQSKNFSGAVPIAQQLVQLKPTSQNLKLLGNAQLYSGAPSDALTTYDQAISVANTEKPAEGQPNTAFNDNLSQIYIGKGNAMLRLKRNDEAIANYKHSAELASNKGLAWFNVCAVLFNIGNTTDSPDACRKCIAADPTRANAYFILGSVIFADAKISANGKVILSSEGLNVLNKYLELAPNGPHAADTKAMLDMVAK